jgi:hypothetical protein
MLWRVDRETITLRSALTFIVQEEEVKEFDSEGQQSSIFRNVASCVLAYIEPNPRTP